VTRHHRQRLLDVQAALDAIDAHVHRGDLSDGLIFDAVRVRLIEILLSRAIERARQDSNLRPSA
jgi:hypothetical protein